ncbi:MAG: alpha/beta fold hydrolase [Sporichthyaceae bacterium]
MRQRRAQLPVIAMAAAGALLVAGVSVASPDAGDRSGAGTAASPEPDVVRTIAWGRCADPDLRAAKAQCGSLSVPLDWAVPTGRQITLAVSRVKARGKAPRQGVMLTNPGGPGGSGLSLPAFLPDAVPRGAGKLYDWIGFDPRGVGASRPALGCDPAFAKGPRPDYTLRRNSGGAGAGEPAERAERAWLAKIRAYIADCQARNAALLPHVKTVDTVRDLDALRAALGAEQINFYGFSYGTFLAQAYASAYPNRVRRLVLDSSVPPDYPGYGDGGRAQAIAFEAVITEFFGWLAAHHATYALGRRAAGVRAAYAGELAALRRAPLAGVGPAEWADVFSDAGFAEEAWPEIAAAWAAWRDGRRGAIRGLYQAIGSPGDDNSYAAFLATVCTDGPFPRSYAQLRREAFALAPAAPFGIWGGFWFSAPCTFWPVPPGEPARVDGALFPGPILLIHATGDGAAPYAGALAVRREFAGAVLVAERGATTHAGSLYGNRCIDAAVAAYLATGALPARRPGDRADATCARTPVPVP